MLFPVLVLWNIGRENRRIAVNYDTLIDAIIDFLGQTKDESSVYSAIKASYKKGDNKLVADLFGLLYAGADTGSHTLTAMMFYYKKYPTYGAAVLKELHDAIGNGRVEDLTLA